MAVFLCDGLGAIEAYESGNKGFSVSRENFFLLGAVWIAAMQGEPPAERSYRHLAFKIEEDALVGFHTRLLSLGVDIRPPRPRVDGEGLSHSFHHFDNHLYERHTGTLAQRFERHGARSPENPEEAAP